MSNFLSQQIRLASDSARQVLKKNNIENVPVDPEEIAESLGIKIVKMSFEKKDISGLIKREGKDGQPVIAVNELDPEVRQRFTIAHEIGHFLLHKTDGILIDVNQVNFRDENSSTGENIKEIQANKFAAELLMPSYLLIDDLKKYINDDKKISENIGELSDKYNVSEEAMMIRIGKLLG